LKETIMRLISVLFCLAALSANAESAMKFDFAGRDGFTKLSPDDTYSPERGYGFDRDTKPTITDGVATSDKSFYFSVKALDGNYRVTITFGDAKLDSDNTIKAESRRLMVQNLKTRAGETLSRSFTVNIRTPQIDGGSEVKLKDREKNVLHWDDKLTLEFNGRHPAIQSIEIARADNLLTVYLLGDSTVTDQPNEPWNSWGQMLPRFFKDDIAVANNAESGETLASSYGAFRLRKVLSTLKQGDYVFIQFGHNDMKDKKPGAGAFTTYQAMLVKYIDEIQAKGGKPVLVTSMHRRRFDKQGKVVDTLGDYPEAVRRVAKEKNLPLIDLHAMSEKFYEALGPEKSAAAFQDGTHHNNYGSYELARCIVEGIRANVPDLASHLAEDAGTFDPSKPDPVDSVEIAASPAVKTPATKPDGN
jgi:lysophospholipase L1-like esterase